MLACKNNSVFLCCPVELPTLCEQKTTFEHVKVMELAG